jgi:small-conductance mechanosensitive channel
MWAWIIVNGVWMLLISALVLLIVLYIRHRFQDRIEKAMPLGWQSWRLHRNIDIAFWVVEGIASAVIVVGLIATVLSEEGAAAIITPQAIEKWLLEQGSRIFVLLLVGIGLWIALERFLPPLVHRTMARPKRGESLMGMKKREDTLRGVFLGLGKIIIILIIVLMILSELTVDIGPILAGFGIAGIAVGFGAQYLIRDIIAGIFILWENQYRVGDVARIADIAGLVEEVNLRKTVLRDLDGIVHHVPNGEIKVASNFTRHFSRVNLNISVAYGTDLDHAISVINRVGKELAKDENWRDRIITAPQVLRVDNLGDSGIDIKILGDVKPLEQWNITGELRLRLKKAFDGEGIEIPWPHIKLYFGQSGASGELVCKNCSQTNLPGSRFCSGCGAKLSP